MAFQTPNGQLLYRVGDIIITINNENPSKIYGGTWQLLCPGKTLVCVDTSDNDFNVIKKTGGAKTHTLSINEMPKHYHSGLKWLHPDGNEVRQFGADGGGRYSWEIKYITNGTANGPITTGYAGNSYAHNNLQPYMAVYMWVRNR